MIANPARQTEIGTAPIARHDAAAGDSFSPATAPGGSRRRRGSYPRFVALLVLAVLALRSFVVTPFTIPSESMLPSLMKGDYLIAAKWPYGWSRWSLPFDAPLITGMIAPRLPNRGDIAIFRHPVDRREYIKRVIGLPGDRVEMLGGELVLNGQPVPRSPFADFIIPVSPNTTCAWGARRERDGVGRAVCRYRRFTETLPDGRSYLVLDFGATPQDSFGPVIVPPGHLLMLGDNRDNSQDSRFPGRPGGGIGLVPQSLLVARAELVLFSSDGSAQWYNPFSWLTAARWNHMGERL